MCILCGGTLKLFKYPVSLQIFNLFMFVYISIYLRFPIFSKWVVIVTIII